MSGTSVTGADEGEKKSKLVILPPRSWVPIHFSELWGFRELLYFFVWRDVKIRYKQSLLGFSWAIIQPLFMMVIFSLLFGRFAKMPSDGIPYPLYSIAAVLPWTLFAQGLDRSTTSMVREPHLMTKVYFPRMIMPLAGVISPLVDFAAASTILIGMMAYYGAMPTANIVWLPLLIIFAVLSSLGVSLWLSALNVQYRDFQYVVPFLVQIWLFASPVVYPSSILPEPWQTLSGLNPMAGVIAGFRWALLGTSPPSMMILLSAVIVVVLLVTGAFYFKRMEQYFADVI